MGVMSCSRNNCDNIMCDTHIYDVGYICWECQKEFKEYLTWAPLEKGEEVYPQTQLQASNGIVVITEGQITKALKVFMETEKNYYTEGKEIDVDDFFRENTKGLK